MCSLDIGEYDGWENYPQNLQPPTTIDVDSSRCNGEISRLSKELFVADHESEFGYLNLGVPNKSTHFEK
jgi:hypothetical protein